MAPAYDKTKQHTWDMPAYAGSIDFSIFSLIDQVELFLYPSSLQPCCSKFSNRILHWLSETTTTAIILKTLPTADKSGPASSPSVRPVIAEEGVVEGLPVMLGLEVDLGNEDLALSCWPLEDGRSPGDNVGVPALISQYGLSINSPSMDYHAERPQILFCHCASPTPSLTTGESFESGDEYPAIIGSTAESESYCYQGREKYPFLSARQSGKGERTISIGAPNYGPPSDYSGSSVQL